MTLATDGDAARFLASTRFLDTLPITEIRVLARQVRRLHFKTGSNIFTRGEPGSYIYWLVKGRAKLTVNSSDGHELLHSIIEVGDHFGELTAISGGTRGVNAVAYRACEVFALDRQFLLPAITGHPETAAIVMVELCGMIRTAGITLEHLALHNAETRIWSRLMFFAQRYAQTHKDNGSLHIEHGLSQQELADSVGLTRVMVNRQMNIWREASLVEYGRGFVLIKDQKAFQSFVQRGSTRFEAP